MMNPFLAAAAAAAANGGQPSSLLNNISNLANNSIQKQHEQQNNFWPWLNMAAMSALYNGNGGNPNSNINPTTAANLIESKFFKFQLLKLFKLFDNCCLNDNTINKNDILGKEFKKKITKRKLINK